MKLAHFFAISAALHAAGFFYPFRFTTYIREELIPVTVVAMDQLAGGSGAGGTAKTSAILKPAVQTGWKNNGPANFSRRATSSVAKVKDQAVSTGIHPAREAGQAIVMQISEPEQQPALLQNPSAFNNPSGTKVAFVSSWGSDGRGSVGSGLGDGQGQGLGAAGSQGSGSGFGSGSELSQSELRFIPARYREFPKPFYPESARREGREGRVLLRVLVDQDGKSKTVEISGSSGSETLDHAAAETIKRWRFSPARFGDTPVESWVRIPIDFHLTDTKD